MFSKNTSSFWIGEKIPSVQRLVFTHTPNIKTRQQGFSEMKRTSRKTRRAMIKREVTDHSEGDVGRLTWELINRKTFLLPSILYREFSSEAIEKTAQSYAPGNRWGDIQVIDELIHIRKMRSLQKRKENKEYLSLLTNERGDMSRRGELLRNQNALLRLKHCRSPDSLTVTVGSIHNLQLTWDDDSNDSGSNHFGPRMQGTEEVSLVTDVDAFVDRTRQQLPLQSAKCRRLRAFLSSNQRPYDGEFGPESYNNWQLANYCMIRGLLEEFINHFLDDYLSHEERIHGDSSQLWRSLRRKEVEKRYDQLIVEEILLEVTAELSATIAKHLLVTFETITKRSDELFIHATELAALDNGIGRDVQNPVHRLVADNYYAEQISRRQNRSKLWRHTLTLKEKSN